MQKFEFQSITKAKKHPDQNCCSKKVLTIDYDVCGKVSGKQNVCNFLS